MEVIKLDNKIDLSNITNLKNTCNNSEKSENEEPQMPTFEEMQKMIKESEMQNLQPEIITPVLSPEESIERRKIIIHIKNYIKSFPDCLEEFKKIDFDRKSTIELENIKEEVKLTVCNSNNSDIFTGIFMGGCDALEGFAPIINYDLTGLKYIACKNENVLKCVKEISLEYQSLNYIRPEKRLFLLMFTLCYGVNNMNKINKITSEKVNKDIGDIENKYKDL